MGGWEGEVVPGDVVWGKPAGLERLSTRPHLSSGLAAAKDDDDDARALGGWPRVDAHQGAEIHLQTDLLLCLSYGCLLGRLVDLHVAGGEGPGAAAGLDGAAQKKQAAAALDDDAGDDFRVEVDDALALVADQAGAVFRLQEALAEVTAAVWAEAGRAEAEMRASHSGCRVGCPSPSIQASPPSQTSFFQMGATSLMQFTA